MALLDEVGPFASGDLFDSLGIIHVAKDRRNGHRQRVRPAVDVVRFAEDLNHRGRLSGVVVHVVGLARRRVRGEVLATDVPEEHVDRLGELLVRPLEEDELLALFVVGVLLGDGMDAALGSGEGLVGVRRPHVEQFDVAVAPAVLAEGVVDVGGLADLDVHDFQPGVFKVRNPNRVDHFAHGQVL